MSTPSPEPTTDAGHSHKALKVAKKIVFAMLLLNIAAFAPAIVLGALGWHDAVNVAMLAGLASFMACGMGSGWVTGLRTAVPFAVFVSLTVWAAPYAIPAGLVLGAAAFWRGFGARLGLHNALMMSVIALGFLVTDPPKFEGTFSPPIVAGLVALGSCLYVTLVMFVARGVIKPPPLTKLVTARVVAYSVILFFMIGIVTWGVIRFDLGHGGSWIILTILVVFQPYLGTGFRKAGQRVIGTVGGFVLALILGEFVSGGVWLYVLGVALFTVAGTLLMLGKPYGVFVLFLTPAVVLVTSAGSTVDKTAIIRLEATAVGVVIVLLVMLALTPLAKHLQQKHGAPTY
ncbi:MAG: hypothetical protein RL205_1733 [Actinomycetota bacterium]|jgi:hypothetical protein